MLMVSTGRPRMGEQHEKKCIVKSSNRLITQGGNKFLLAVAYITHYSIYYKHIIIYYNKSSGW